MSATRTYADPRADGWLLCCPVCDGRELLTSTKAAVVARRVRAFNARHAACSMPRWAGSILAAAGVRP